MNTLDSHPDALEEGVRDMLHRLAAGVRENPPAWEDLIARDGEVVPLRTEPVRIIRLDHARRWCRRPATSVAAAALVAAAVGGALLVDRTGGGGDRGDEGLRAEPITAVSPGDPSFDAGSAVCVWATGIDDPVAAAGSYLQAMGIPTAASAPAAAAMTLREIEGSTAIVDWLRTTGGAGGAEGESGGTVFLRATPAPSGAQDWGVVGASAPDLVLDDVSYDRETGNLSFSVARTGGVGELAVGVWIDGQPVPLSGPPVPQAGAGGISLGQLLDLGSEDAPQAFELPVESDDIVTLRVVDVVHGYVQSVEQMAMAMPDADPASAGLAGSVVGDGSAGHGTSPGGVSGTAEGGGSATIDTGPLDNVTVPSLPVPTDPGAPLPTLPPLPVPDPTAVTVPTTVPEGPVDILP